MAADVIGALQSILWEVFTVTVWTLLPVLVSMSALMRVLQDFGVLAQLQRRISPWLRPFGLPGISALAMIQMLFVSFAAPVATLKVLDCGSVTTRHIAATLAMLLCMSQANVVFPLARVGLNVPVALLTSIVGGLVAAAVTYYLFARATTSEGAATELPRTDVADIAGPPFTLAACFRALISGAADGLRTFGAALWFVVPAIVFLNIIKFAGATVLIERQFSPLLVHVGLPGAAALPIATKYLAGGTSMLAITHDLVSAGTLTANDLNRLCGFAVNPFDLVGVMVMIRTGSRVRRALPMACVGACVGIAVRTVAHLVIF